jgi:hypothetical protein
MTDPNKLVRREAGTYRSADDRFEVRGEGSRWFLVDAQQTDELGQELVRGPFATLNAVRQAIPEARRADLKPLRASKSATRAASSGAKARTKAAPKPSWIDRLPKSEAANVRGLIRALEREGIKDAENIVRRDREGLAPEVAQTLIERRLEALLDEVPKAGRDTVRALIRQVAAVLTVDGTRQPERLPGWVLVEVGPEPEPPNRRITLPD